MNTTIKNNTNNGIVSKIARSPEEYMTERVQFKINLYFKKAKQQRMRYLAVSVIVAVSAALVPVLVNIDVERKIFRYLATVFSLMVGVGVAMQEIFRWREHWRNYDLIDARLRNEEMLFSMSASPYNKEKDKDEKERFEKFVTRVEEIIAQERIETIHMRTSVNGEKKDNEPG
jgi:Protein of unknown function (DUF4231)